MTSHGISNPGSGALPFDQLNTRRGKLSHNQQNEFPWQVFRAIKIRIWMAGKPHRGIAQGSAVAGHCLVG
jgi:hypothetical protein